MERREEEQRLLCKTEADPTYVYTTCLERCCLRARYHLTSEELESLTLLRRRVNIPFDKGNSLHKVRDIAGFIKKFVDSGVWGFSSCWKYA
jgi:hypothetical protein